MFNNNFMSTAIEIAKKGQLQNEIPVGAIIVKNKKIIAHAHNLILTCQDPTAHAEIEAIRNASKFLNSYNLSGCDLYVTLEPCPMCAYAISLARISRLFFGALDVKRGAIENGPRLYNYTYSFHKPEVFGSIMENECSEILKNFFKSLR